MKLFGSLKELVSAVFRKDSQEITLKPSTLVTYNAARNVELPAQNSDAVLVSRDSQDTFTNKTFDAEGTGNTLSNIKDSNIKAGAAIDASKIGSGLVSNTEFGYLDGVTSAIQTQINGKQATITGAATTIVSADLSASKALQSDASGKVSASSVTSTELGYVSGVTSSIQTQLGNKASSGANSDITSLSGLTTPLSAGQGGTGINNGGTLTYGANNISLTTSGATSLTLPTSGTVATTSNKLSAFAATSSSELAGVISDETGSGSLVFGTSPTLSSPQVNSSLVVQQIATPSNPSAGFNKIYTKSDGLLYKLDSSGNEVAVGSGAGGSGEINAVLNSSAATDTTGWAAGTSHTVTKDSSNSPLSPVVSTSFAISSSAAIALGSQTSTSGVYDAITMPSGLQNRKLKVEFFYTTPASSAGTWAVAVYQGSTKVALSTDSSGDTILPAGVTGGKFTAYFDTTSSASYSLNLVQRARTGANTLYITNVIVGPGIQPQGAVVGEWTNYTPTFNGFGTTSSNAAYYRRVGDSMELHVRFTAGTSTAVEARVGLPNNLTVDVSKQGSLTALAGKWIRNNATGTLTKQGAILSPATSSSYVLFSRDDYTSAISPFTILNGSDVASGEVVSLFATVPIAEWAGSGTVQLAQNDVEFAWNSDPGTTAGTTYSNSAYYGYGPNGTPIVAVNSTTATGESKSGYTVQFQTPVQASDQVVVELNDGNGWFNAAQRLPGVTNNLASYGITLVAVNSTTYRVFFGNAGIGSAGATTYGSASANGWSIVSGWRWRVRKSSAGAAVGFGKATKDSSGLVRIQPPTQTIYTSGSGTYTTPSNVAYIKVRMVGGGGGGTGGQGGGSGGTGGNTTFGSSFLTANGGGGGNATNGNGGAGGTATVGAGAFGFALTGARGQGASAITTVNPGGSGGYSPFGGAGEGDISTTTNSAVANTGSGGAGARANGTSTNGSGGGAGGYLEATVSSPSASYSYAVGAAGTAGTAGTAGSAGGAGGSGVIIIDEYYY